TDACGVCIGGTTGRQACKTLAPGSYAIKPVHSMLCLENGATVLQQNCTSANNQIWTATKTGNYYEFKSAGNAMYLSVPQTTSGTALTQTTGTTNRQWRLEDAGNNSYHLVPSGNMDVVADISGANLSAGTSSVLWTRTNNANNQKFEFISTKITGLEEESETEGISFSPNPFVQEITLEANGIIEYEVHDLFGYELEKGRSSQKAFVGTNLAPGSYIIKARFNGESKVIRACKK
ncbi:MAG: RICIN domain-containing protein, partial [Opitutaceae bacterium]|nr:RICIN domain-containing protein [Cytophagales bacterium]